MIKIDFKKTEYLEKEITQEGIERWNKERKRIIKRLTPSIAITILTGIADAVLLVVMSFLLQYFIDGIQQTGKIEVPLLIALVSLVILLAVINYYNSYLSQVLQIKGLRLVSSYTYSNALHNDEFIKKVKSGDIVRLVSADSEAIGQRLGLRISMISDGVLQTVIVLGIIFYFSWIVGIAVVIFYPLYFFLSDIVNKKLEKCYYENAKDFANVSHVRLKGIQGWLELAILKKRAFYAEKYNDSFEKAKKSLLKTCKWKAILMMLSVSAGYYIPVISVIVCTLPILFGESVNVSSMLIVYMLAGYLINPLNSFTYAFQMYSEDKALYKRMSDLLFINPEEGNEGEDVGEIKDIDINIDDYSYGGDELLLKNCRLHAERGDVVSVTGDSGCGKSTLFKLLVKQNPYELLHGSIQFNGKPVQSLSKDKLYDEMQYVSQNYFVFEDTLYNNLCMGDEFSKEQIDKAIDICCLNEFVAEYGLDMVMEENGKNISQGQLQRVCIARSLLREPRCLMLDEPTSALDKATGDKLMENIARYTKERGAITFVISHKDDAISRANKSIQLAK